MSNYPPGVTGNEPQIVGYPECPECDQPFDGEKCECGFEVPGPYDCPSGHDTNEEARGER